MENDALEGIIIDRLAARQGMVKQMEQWERKRSWQRPFYASMAIAACAAGLMLAWPMLQPPTTSPLDELGISITVPQYRAGSPETARIEKLIANEDYEQALELTQKLLEESDDLMAKMQWLSANDDEELEYERQVETAHNCELRWTYICLLTRLEQWDAARHELKRYLKHKHFCEHEDEARQLLKALKGK